MVGILFSELLFYYVEWLGFLRRSVIESFNGKLCDWDYLFYWGVKKFGNYVMIYFIEEKVLSKCQFVSFEVWFLKVLYLVFVEFFEFLE